jgi:hypothetical protein
MVPSISASGTIINGTEGMSFTGAVATFTDTDASATVNNFTASIAWGDGTTSAGTVQATNNGFQVSGGHTYADEGSPSVSVTINDIDGSSATATSTAQVADNDALSANGYNLSGTEGNQLNGIVATFTDVTYPTNSPSDFTANINWGDGASSAGTVTSQGNLFVVRGSHTYGEEGSYSIKVTIQDDGGAAATANTTSTASIADAPLTATGTPVGATEGASFSGQVAMFTDANPAATIADDFIFPPPGSPLRIRNISNVTIDWGDGTGVTEAFLTQPGGVGTPFVVNGTHTYAEEGPYTIKVSITDNGGSKVTATSTATVADAPLTATGTPVHGVEGIPFSGQLATFTDANPNAPIQDFVFNCPLCASPVDHRVNLVIDWGDNSGPQSDVGDITQPGGIGTPFVVSGSHLYAKGGSYTITLTVTDNGGSTATTTATATVTDPDDIVGRVSETGQIWTGVSTGSSFNSSLWATLDPKVTWVDTVTGDFNGDGRTDIAARDLATGQWWVAMSNGSSFTASVWDSWNPKVTWTNVQVGDFNGDGKMDIIGRPQGEGHWWVARSTGSSFVTTLWATWSAVTWADVKVGDFNGDGKTDITSRWLEGGSWWTGVSTGSSFTTSMWAAWSTGVTWVDVQVGDFNGDGKSDITGRVLETGQWWTGLSTGSSFSTTYWTTWNAAVTWVDVKVGDFNGDGKSDIIGRVFETGQWWAGISTGSTFTNSLWSTWSTGVTWVDVQVGDFNGDGKSDITGRVLETGQWWTGLSNGSALTNSLWATWSTSVTWTGVHTGDFA